MTEESPMIGGVFHVEHWRDEKCIWEEDVHNIVTTEGMVHILDSVLDAASQITTWYVGLIEDTGDPVVGDTMTELGAREVGKLGTNDKYDETVRETYAADAATGTTSVSTTNSTTADFTFNTTDTVYGAFVSSNSTKGGTTGTLLAAKLFTSSRAVVSSDILKITYTFTITNT